MCREVLYMKFNQAFLTEHIKAPSESRASLWPTLASSCHTHLDSGSLLPLGQQWRDVYSSDSLADFQFYRPKMNI